MDRIALAVSLQNENLSQATLLKVIDKILFFQPTRTVMFDEYSKEKIEKHLVNVWEKNEDFYDTLSDENEEGNSLTINVSADKKIHLTGLIDQGTFRDSTITESITSIFEEIGGGVYAYLVSKEDRRWQNNDSISLYKKFHQSLDGIRIIPHPKLKKQLIIDVTQFPGHNRTYKGLWFGSCWMMWYGNEYFHFLDREKMVTFLECEEKYVLSDGTVRIKLYNDPFAYNEEENRRRQWAFRDYMNIDEIVNKHNSR
ncbi:hypothetical protein [Brevibacillus parabrevis]|uniref:hypothetical protein n=1 Tax=Brevibacillus parabrevis TaxID=54914 RepID=UPI001F60BB14|nr:hypothetical protein [Brevibacillus parabrevis]MDR5002170.1 hypothetical protein [Brevibacillus parabrevis]